MPQKTAVIYCRVSTIKQLNDGGSLENQETACRAYCKQNNLQVLGVFRDAYTGKRSDRPDYINASNFSIENQVHFFVIFDLDRFSREGYEVYKMLKNELQKHSIRLKDSKNVIGDERNVIENDLVNMSLYPWNRENPTEMSEMVYSAQAQIEGKKILQRTIPREIQLEQQGYQIRDSNIGYMNTKIKTMEGKRVIQVAHHTEGPWIVRMFDLKAQGLLTDDQIVEEINALGYKSRNRSIKLTVKQMQVCLKKPIYAGIIQTAWTGHTPIRAQYDGLVSVETWNRANRGKLKIVEGADEVIKIVIGDNGVPPPPIRRKKFSSDLPFRNLVKSSQMPGAFISGSYSSNFKGDKFAYYHPIRKKGQKGENITKEAFEKTIFTLFQDIHVNDVLKEILIDRFERIFQTKKDDISQCRKGFETRLKEIRGQVTELEQKILSIPPSLTRVLTSIEASLAEFEAEEQAVEAQLRDFTGENFSDPEKFKDFCFYIIEHLSELLSTSQNLEEIKTIFSFVFTETPTYQEVVNRTARIYPIFAYASPQKNSREGIFEKNQNWQSSWESNPDQRLWRPLY